MTLVTADVTKLWWLLEDFSISVFMSTPLLYDSIRAISIARDPVKYEFTNHIGVDAYYTRSHVHNSITALHHVTSKLQLVDFLTKAQTRAHHPFYLFKLSVFDPP
jgi:hypothetical protein